MVYRGDRGIKSSKSSGRTKRSRIICIKKVFKTAVDDHAVCIDRYMVSMPSVVAPARHDKDIKINGGIFMIPPFITSH